MKLTLLLFLSVWLAIICTSLAEESHPQKVTHHQHGSVAAGGGQDNGKKLHLHKSIKKSGKKSVHDEEKAKKGEKLKELHTKQDEEKGGKKTEHHSGAKYSSHKKAGGASQDGAKFREGAKHKKGNFRKGFRELYHKDEEKKHDGFYSMAHKSGEYEVFGSKHNKHQLQSFVKKQKNNHKAGKAEDAHGKSGKKVGGHNVEEKQGHQGQKAFSTHHEQKDKWAKKGGKKGGKQYKYKIPQPKQ